MKAPLPIEKEVKLKGKVVYRLLYKKISLKVICKVMTIEVGSSGRTGNEQLVLDVKYFYTIETV